MSLVEEILTGLYRIELPLPDSSLKALNSYVIKGDGRYLIIDTGMNRTECFEAMTRGLRSLSVDLDRADIFVTHMHADHLGQAASFARPGSNVYLSECDIQALNEGLHRRDKLYDFFLDCGFPRPELDRAIASHPGHRYGLRENVAFTPVGGGDFLQIGDYCLECVPTPGHTPGHMCLYDARKKLLFSGDHVLIDITPNISFWPEREALREYLESLDKVYPLDTELVLPGHRRFISDFRGRIGEIRAHHADRFDEVIRAIGMGKRYPYEVTPCVTWDVREKVWEKFPPRQKWFAFSETLAHIQYLEATGKVQRNHCDGQITFSLT